MVIVLSDINWTLYDELLGGGSSTGASSRQKAIDDAAANIEEGMKDDPAYQKDAVIDGVVTPIVASRSSTLTCDLKAATGTNVHIGDIVYTLDENWIVVELFYDKIGIVTGTMWLCNHVLHFQNYSSMVYSRYCVIDDGSYAKISRSSIAPSMSNSYKVYLSADPQSRMLYVDKRLSLGKIHLRGGEIGLEVYDIVGVDLITKNYGAGSHLMTLTVERGVYDKELDDMNLDVCNAIYDVPNDEIDPSPVGGACAIEGRDKIRIGTRRKYTPAFFSSAGERVEDDVLPTWSVSGSSVITEEDGTDLYISVPLNKGLVGSEIEISLSDESGMYGSCTKKVKVITVG